MKKVRFFRKESHSAPENMAIDETLFRSIIKKQTDGVLRFYEWCPYALSFGLFQHPENILVEGQSKYCGIDTVRRSTGGKMVFHADEITFSAGLPLAVIKKRDPDAKNFLEFFKVLITPFVLGLQKAGIPASFSVSQPKGNSERIHCYSAPAAHSIMVDGKKLVGAAGIIKADVFFVHGSIPRKIVLPPDNLFKKKPDAFLKEKIACLDNFLPEEKQGCLESIISESFSDFFDATLELGELSKIESETAEIFSREKYSDLFWNRKDLSNLENLCTEKSYQSQKIRALPQGL
ncbi:MAG: lipoate--protein ligase family protein [Candidatus Riflebacteria bacterium]|nr:lipoate--protein ligase family protein [Candidatus Riflebacteria bacterium]